MKILAALGIVFLKIVGMLLNILTKIVSFLAGPFLAFVIGCGFYCLVTTNWKSLVILAVIGVGTAIIFIVAGLILGIIDLAGCKLNSLIKS